MTDWNNWLVFDILGDMCFGRSFEIKEPGPNPIREMPRLAVRHAQLIYPVSLSSTQTHITNTNPDYPISHYGILCLGQTKGS